MNLNEVKKALYKQKPFATLVSVRKDGILYYTIADVLEEDGLYETTKIQFLVPLNEIGETVFNDHIPAQSLIRYIIQ